MHRTLRSARTAAALALTLGVALVLPGAAFAGTTEPTPVTTTSTTSTGTSTTAEPTGSTTTPAATSTTTSIEPTTTTPGTGTTTTDSSTPSPSSTTATPSAPSTTAAPKVKPAAPLKQVPFGAHPGLRASLLPGDSSNRAGYAAGFMVRTLAARGDHYNYPASTFFDGGNTIDAILGLDGAKGGLDEADAAFGYLDQNLGSYNGGDPQFGLYAGPTAKALLAVVAHGGDPSDFGNQDLLDLLDQSLGAIEPGRYSDLPVDCGFPQCDFSNTIGQSLAIIAVGRATGDVAQEAADFLLDQQCPDGGFRGDLDAAGCTSDLDATAFAVQAVIGLLGADDQAATDALDFLASRQAANGGFLNQDGQYNANTAGVAAQAFAAGGRSTQLIAAQGFLATLQLDCGFAAALRGGIAFTSADRTILGGTPQTDAQRKAFDDATDRALRATPQATLGLAGGSLLTVTSDGAVAAAPAAPTCVAPTTTTTTTVPRTTTTTTTPAVADPASATPGSLAFTGSNVAALTLLGAMLLLVGAGAIVLARRKGVHA